MAKYSTQEDVGIIEVDGSAWQRFADQLRSLSEPVTIPSSIVQVEYVAAPDVKACIDCGSWSKPCDCPRVQTTMTRHCYLCDAQHDPRVQAPRVCEMCRRRYL